MRNIIYIFVILMTSQFVICQGEDNNWMLSGGKRIQFNNDQISITDDGKIPIGRESQISISDSTGELLFYTDGRFIWDRNHNVMPNGQGLKGFRSASQVASIVSIDNQEQKYFLFFIRESQRAGYNSLYYCIVDMSLNDGLGDVDDQFKNILLQENITESQVVFNKECFTWLIVHGVNSNKFFAYKVSSERIDTPVISEIGELHVLDQYNHISGQMDISSSGDKIAVSSKTLGLELFKFDFQTGIFSNPIFIKYTKIVDRTMDPYGVSFSPNGNYLYLSEGISYSFENKLVQLSQFDVSIFDEDSIRNSRIIIGEPENSTSIGFDIKAGPDQKLYLGRTGDGYLGVIQNPDIKGLDCNYVDDGLFIGILDRGTGLQGSIAIQKFGGDLTMLPPDIHNCTDSDIFLNVSSYGNTFVWQDGNTNSEYTISESGKYWVDVTTGDCTFTDTIQIVLDLETLNLGQDITSCEQASIIIESPIPNASSHTWSTGETTEQIIVSTSGDYWLEVETVDGCLLRDTINVSFEDVVDLSLGDDLTECSSSSITLSASKTGNTYRWNTGETTETVTVTESGTYWLDITTADGCTVSDTIQVNLTSLTVELGDPQELCAGDSLIITLDISDASYFWSDGTMTDQLIIKEAGTYWVEVEQGPCIATDTLQVMLKDCMSTNPIDTTSTVTPPTAIPDVPCSVYLPNAINPRSTNVKNTAFQIFSNCQIEESSYSIFDRWGNVLYASQGNTILFSDMDLNPGVYVAKVHYRLAGQAEYEELLQSLTVL